MISKLSGWDDTIVAISTAPGIGAIAVVRLSGPASFDIVNQLFPSKDVDTQHSHTIHVGFLQDGVNVIDEVVLSLFRSPRSYTGEDVIEISCHGSPYIQQQIMQSCIGKGARSARPGEFTQRAFLNGKLDLTQAEAVADLIASNTDASQKTALNNIRGGFSLNLKAMREQLIQFASLIELELDFAEEDVAFADRSKFYTLIGQLDHSTRQLIQSFRLGNVVKNGVSVAIIGKPNAGKSTLLNTLLNESRAIVSDIAGTTRDTIEETININGIIFRLIDTAGIRAHSADVIENIGIEKSIHKMKTADLVIYIFDANTETGENVADQIRVFEELSVRYLLAGNKADVMAGDFYRERFADTADVHLISARNNIGIDDFKLLLYHVFANEGISTDQTIVTNARHFEALQQIQQCIIEIRNGLDQQLSGDLITADIRRCLYYLGEITGEITNEDKLDYIFSKFCIGK